MNTIDLQTHSNHSDGNLSPCELVKYAASQGIRTLALVDHDTVSGIDEALECSSEHGLELIPGVEITTNDTTGEYHILGYYVKWKAQEFAQAIKLVWDRRRDRNVKFLENLTTAGFPITITDVERTVQFRLHDRKDIARTMVALGYVRTIRDAFSDELLGERSPLYVQPPVVSPEDGIKLILSGHGIPVLAHPGTRPGGRVEAYPITINKIAEFVNMGLQGLEVYYSRHSSNEVEAYRQIALKLGLIPTGGSDFHRIEDGQPEIGDTGVPDEILTVLKAKASDNRGKTYSSVDFAS